MSGNEPIRLDFGKKLGYVELKKDGGIQESAFGKNETALSIFKHYNADKNTVLDESELEKLYGDLEKAAGKDKKLTAGEAVKFFKGMGIKNVKAGEAQSIIKTFIGAIGGDKDIVESAVKDAQNSVTVKYKDGKEEKYLYDAKTGKSVLSRQRYADDEGNHSVTFENDGKTKASEEIRTDNTIKNVEYKNGKVDKETTLKDFSSQDISVGAELVPAETKGIRIIKDADNNITQEFLDNSLGVLATREISADGKTIIQKDAEGKETARFEKDESGEMRLTARNENGVKTVIDGDKETTQFSETRTMEKTDDAVTLKDGDKGVTLKYDDKGHIIAYAKEGENFKATAKRLGIDVNNEQEYKEFCELNKDAVKRSHGGWFKIGEEVKLPTGFEAKLNVGEYDVDVKAEEAKWKEKVNTYVPQDPGNSVTRAKDDQGREIITEKNADGEVVHEVINGANGSRRVDGMLELAEIEKYGDVFNQVFDMAIEKTTRTSTVAVHAKTKAELKKKTDELTGFKSLYAKVRKGTASEQEKQEFESKISEYLDGGDKDFQSAAFVGYVYSGIESDELFDKLLTKELYFGYEMAELMDQGIISLSKHRIEKMYDYATSSEQYSNYILKNLQKAVVKHAYEFPEEAKKMYQTMTHAVRCQAQPRFTKKDVLEMINNPDNFDPTKHVDDWTGEAFNGREVYDLFMCSFGESGYTTTEFQQILKHIPVSEQIKHSAVMTKIHMNVYMSDDAKKNFHVVQKGENINKILDDVLDKMLPAELSTWQTMDRATTLGSIRKIYKKQMIADMGLKCDEKGNVKIYEGQILDCSKIFKRNYNNILPAILGSTVNTAQNWQYNK